MYWNRLALTTLLSAVTAGPAIAQHASPDLILHHGKIVTVDERFSIAPAMAIRDGRIVAVGEDAPMLAMSGAGTRTIDLEGRTVIPGLIDNHLHYLRGASTWRHEVRLDGMTSRADALAAIAAKAASSMPGAWVFVLGGWNERQFADRPGGFTTEELDRAAPHNPVFIQKSYSETYQNRLAAEQLGTVGVGNGGLQRGTRGPSSSGRGRGGARTTIAQAMRHLPESSPTERVTDVRQFNTALNSLGLTTVYDVGRANDGDFSPVETLANAGALNVRVFHTLRYSADNPLEASQVAGLIERTKPRQSNEWFGLIGIGEHTYGPLHDSAVSVSVFPDEDYAQFEKLATAAAAAGWSLHEHAMQDATIGRMLDICTEIHRVYPIDKLRWTLAHCDGISAWNVERAKRLGMTLAVHDKTAKPVSTDGDSPPIDLIQKSGIVWGLGSDATIVSPINPFYSLWWLASGKVFPDATAIRRPITREQALTAHTRSNAYLLFKEQDLGSLEPGKLADLVVLDRDYLTVPVDEIRDLRSVLTVVGGRIVYDAASE